MLCSVVISRLLSIVLRVELSLLVGSYQVVDHPPLQLLLLDPPHIFKLSHAGHCYNVLHCRSALTCLLIVLKNVRKKKTKSELDKDIVVTVLCMTGERDSLTCMLPGLQSNIATECNWQVTRDLSLEFLLDGIGWDFHSRKERRPQLFKFHWILYHLIKEIKHLMEKVW